MRVQERPWGGEDLIALLTEQCTLYAELGQLANGQRALITGDAPEQLLGVLGERQRLIDRIEILGRRLRPYQSDWRRTRAELNDEQGGRVDELVSRVNGLLAGILKADAADAELLAARKSAAADHVRQVKTERRAGVAYAAGVQASGSQIDWMGE